MKENELRIGNYVNEYDKPEKVGLRTFRYFDQMKTLMEYTVKPIPLTEEWLLKFGFDSEMICEEDRDRIISKDSFFMYKGTFQHILTGVILKHVHQLQNLYFALTGEELKLDETQVDKK